MGRVIDRARSIAPIAGLSVVLVALAPAAHAQNTRAFDAANGLLQRGLFEPALDEYQTYLDSAPNDHDLIPAARYGRAVCLFRLERFEDALPDLNRLADRDGFEFAAEVEYLRGHVHRRAGRHDHAAESFGAVRARHADHPTAPEAGALWVESLYRAGDLAAAARATVDDIPRGAMGERAQFFSAMARFAQDDFAGAAEAFDAVATARGDVKPGDLRDRAGVMLAQSLERAGREGDAISAYRRVVDRENSAFDTDARVGLAELLERDGELADAAKLIESVQSPETELGRRALLIAGRRALAQRDFERAADRFEAVEAGAEGDRRDEASAWRARALMEGDNAGAAAGVLRRALRRGVENPVRRGEMTYDLGVASSRADREAAAREAFAMLANDQPDHPQAPDALYALALLTHQGDEHEEAIELADRFADRYEDHPRAFESAFLGAESAFALDRFEDAESRFAQLDSPRAAFRRGLCLHAMGQSDDATPLLTAAAARAADEPVYAAALVALADIASEAERWSDVAEWLGAYADVPNAENVDAALVRMGVALERESRHAEASEVFRRVLDEHADGDHAAHARLELGRCLLELDRLADAAEVLAQVEGGAGDRDFEAHAKRLLADIAERRGDSSAAVQYLAEASERAGGALRATTESERAHALLRAGNAAEAAEAFASAVAAAREMDDTEARRRLIANARAWRAISLSRAGNHAEALDGAEGLRARDREALDEATADALQYARARLLAIAGRADDAAEAYAELSDRRGAGDLAFHAAIELAALRVEANEDEQAMTLLGRVLDAEQAPKELVAQAAYNRGVIASRLSMHDEASDAFERFFAVVEEPADDAAARVYASAAFQCGSAFSALGRHARAAEQFDRASDYAIDDETHRAALLRLGDTHAARTDWPRSQAAFDEFLERHAESEVAVQAHFGRGWALEHQGELEDARASYTLAADNGAGPTSARAQFQIGETLYAEGRHDDAIRELMKVDILYAHEEWSAAALYEAGRCFEETGRPTQAREQYRAVAERFGATEWAALAERRLGSMRTGAPGEIGS